MSKHNETRVKGDNSITQFNFSTQIVGSLYEGTCTRIHNKQVLALLHEWA